ncbi:ketopantoate reductase family protein [Halalkalibacter krulwichiae]|uniref:ketopantoate reductase family protein n=1 Tax=Halalkalibacter krulwichiae TaxID=199441 RepID=UPI0008261E0C|nr:ketopantoate reductase family protein [Halalkalibacter krulwichiae]
MKIAIAGSGAMGCRFGSMLFEAGNEVLLVDRWETHVKKIRENGLAIKKEDRNQVLYMDASLPEESEGTFDLVIVFTKSMQTDEMVKSCRHLIGDHTRVLTLQNGLGNIETLETYVPKSRLLAGVTTFGTELLGPGHIQALGTGHVHIMQVDGGESEAVKEICAVMNAAGMNVEVSRDVLISIWNKVAFNAVLNTLCTIINDTVSAVGSYQQIDEVINAIVDEIIVVAEAEGINLNKEVIVKMIVDVFDPKMSGNHLPSMVQDLHSGRPTEIDYLNGAIVEKAKRHNIAVPTNELIYHLIRMLEGRRQ